VIGRIVEVAGENRHLSMDRGFMVVRHQGNELGRIPLDDMAGLVCTAQGVTHSSNLLVALSDRNCPVVVCSSNHKPAAVLWPVDTHHRQASRFDGQVAMSKPARAQLWKQIVQSKIAMQAATLARCGKPSAPLTVMVRKVRSGDRSNVEGQAARTYWKLLMGDDFRRDTDARGINSLLNYGYAILRATVARQVMGSGLHPAVALHHSNGGNSMRLVDDLMEPFRPAVDLLVWHLVKDGIEEVGSTAKRFLASLPTRSLVTPEGISPLTLACQRLCVSLALRCEQSRDGLCLPHRSKRVLDSFLSEPRDEDEEGREIQASAGGA
jgi:CRISPR-associated protein Cas1